MRAWSISLAVSCCAAMLGACSNSAMGTFQPRPGEHFSVLQTPNPGASLSDLASRVTTDTLLRYRGAKMEKAEPFAPCPGEAGLQTFSIPGKPPQLLRVAFSQWNGMEKIATYERPAKASDDPAALAQMKRTVCTG